MKKEIKTKVEENNRNLSLIIRKFKEEENRKRRENEKRTELKGK